MQARKRQEKNYECGWLDSRTQAVNGKGLKAVEWNDKCAYPLYSPELAALSLPLLRRSSNAVVVGILVTLLLMIGTRTLLVLHPRARWRRRLLCLMLPLAVATVLHHRVVRALLLLRRLLVKCPGLLRLLLLVAKVMARLVHRSSTLTIRSYCFSTLTVHIIINRTRQRLLDDLPLKASLGRVPNVSRSNNVWVLQQ